MSNRQKLNLDLSSLFPGETLTIGEQVVDIRPLGIRSLAIVARKLKGFGYVLQEDGVTFDNYSEPENIIKLATLLLEQFPEVLEEASNIDKADLEKLPIEIVVSILDKVISVNMKSRESLEKNFKSLAARLNPTKPKEKVQTTKPKLPKQSKS